MTIAIALLLALVSTTLTNLAYVRQHAAATDLPALSLARPVQAVRMLLADPRWRRGFALEASGYLLYAAALAVAPLALVQSAAAGGIGILAYLSRRISGHRVGRRTMIGVMLSVVGLLSLGLSLQSGPTAGHTGSIALVLVWLGGTAAAAAAVYVLGRPVLPRVVVCGIAGGLCFSVGDIATKLATQWGPRSAFVVAVFLGYGAGTSLLQLGYQAGAALTVAGLATLLANVLPIAAGTVLLEEPVPSGALGGARVFAFFAVTAGAVLLTKPAGET